MSERSDAYETDALPTWMSLSQMWAQHIGEMNPFVTISERSDANEADALPTWMSLSQVWAQQVAEMNPFVKLFPLNYPEMGQALMTVGMDLATNPARARAAWMDLAMQQLEVMIQTSRQAWGLDYETVVEAERKDKRFAAEEWSKNAVFNAIKQSYLLTCRWFLEQLEQNTSLSPAARRKVNFYL